MRAIGVVSLLLFLIRQSLTTLAQSKPIPVGLKIESENGGKDSGMWAQAATDLTPKEVRTLKTLLLADIEKLEGIKVVPLVIRSICRN
jgi:hypothetical protein